MKHLYCYPLNLPSERKTTKHGSKERKDKKRKEKEEKSMGRYSIDHQKWRETTGSLPKKVVKARYRWIYHLYKNCVSKIVRAAPKSCSSDQESPYLLALPHQEMINTSKSYIYNAANSLYLEFDASARLGFTLHRRLIFGFGERWIQEDCPLVGPNSSPDENFNFTNALVYGGKFYALSLQGTLATIDVMDDRSPQLKAKISIIPGVQRAIPSCSATYSLKGFREYLMEPDGEIMLVFLVYRRSMNIVDDVEVFRLDLSRKKGWIRVESLGDRTFILENKCCWMFPPRFSSTKEERWFSESQSGLDECPRNCVYFTDQPGAKWWVFDVGSGSLSAI